MRHPWRLVVLFFLMVMCWEHVAVADHSVQQNDDRSAHVAVEKTTHLATKHGSDFVPEESVWSAQYNVYKAVEAAKLQKDGWAVFYLERARYLRPYDQSIRVGLDAARQRVQRHRIEYFRNFHITQGEVEGLWWWRVFHILPTRLWAAGALVGVWMSILLWWFSLRLQTGVPKDAFRTASVIFSIVCVLSIACWVGAAQTSRALKPAVIVASKPLMYDSPDELSSAKETPDLYEGAVVLIHDESSHWTKLELAGKKRIWVHRDIVAPIEPAQ